MKPEPATTTLPTRVLMGPGPSDVSRRVLAALARPTLGHLDPAYLEVMDDTARLLRAVFRTANRLTLAVPGTGSAGMEACVAGLVEEGDEVIVGVCGFFGNRLAEMAERHGARVHRVEAPWGETIDPGDIERALAAHPSVRLVGIVHAETSTGAHQPLEEISAVAHAAGALLLVDAVTSLGCVELEVDGWRVDACYSCSQKGLSCPPGLAPVTLSPDAEAKIRGRSAPADSWYLDLTLLSRYWGGERLYHHTASSNLGVALREALLMVSEEGLEARWARHRRHHLGLRAGLAAIGLGYIPRRSLPNLNAVHVPAGVDEAAVRRQLLDRHGIEIGAGLGPLRGRAWRIGLMGESCIAGNVVAVLAGLESILEEMGLPITPGAAVSAAGKVLATT
ncbi:MAG: alanine--glyoxylate aminotransferase family protein [Thermoanaerobaculales bacterium]|nr:alanine--glyoxylate aminotransferase family protein [Thermoanaerobaculales bacterium]